MSFFPIFSLVIDIFIRQCLKDGVRRAFLDRTVLGFIQVVSSRWLFTMPLCASLLSMPDLVHLIGINRTAAGNQARTARTRSRSAGLTSDCLTHFSLCVIWSALMFCSVQTDACTGWRYYVITPENNTWTVRASSSRLKTCASVLCLSNWW